MTRTAKRSRDEVRARMQNVLQTDGLEAAVEGLIRILKDPKSPAPAVATAGTAILRANGLLFDKDAGAPPKELHEMDGQELDEFIRTAQRENSALLGLLTGGGDEESAEDDPSAFD